MILTVVVGGARNFSREKSLHFNIDGDIVSFKSIDSLTDINADPGFAGSGLYVPPSNSSSKRYRVNRNFVEKIVTAERVVVKVDLNKSFVEGIFSKDLHFPKTACPAFREFLARMETLKGNN